MADPYIDQFETIIYGLHSREQMKEVCLGKVAALDSMVRWAIAQQEGADKTMKQVLDRQPRALDALDVTTVGAETTDRLVRFGSFLGSIKGHPVSPSVFFGNQSPSNVGRRRLTKLAGAVRHIVAELPKYADRIPNADAWLAEFQEVLGQLETLEKQQRAGKVERAVLAPEVAMAREAWLVVYSANKALIRGLLLHIGRIDLLPLVFDDLAEVHRAGDVSDTAQPEPTVTPAATGSGAQPG